MTVLRDRLLARWIGAAAFALVSIPAITGAQPVRLTLEACLEHAFRESFDYQLAVAAAENSRGNYVGAYSNLLPSLSASAGKSQTTSQQSLAFIDGQPIPLPEVERFVSTQFNVSASINQELLVPEALYSFRQQRASWQGARAGVRASAQDVGIDVITKFYEVVRNERNVELLNETLDLNRDQLRKTEALFELGAVPKADVLESKVAVSQSHRDVIRAENVLVVSKGRLSLAIGKPVDTDIDVVYEPVAVETSLPETDRVVGEAMRARPDVRQSRRALEAARHGKAAAWWSNLPSVRGSLFYGRTFPELDQTFDFESLHDAKNEARWGFSITLQVPIFDGLATKGRKIGAAGAVVSSREALEKKQHEVRLEVREALLDLHAARASLAVSDDEIASAEEKLRLREAMYDHGASTVLELIQARVDLTVARFTQISNETELQLGWFRYLKATGVELRDWKR